MAKATRAASIGEASLLCRGLWPFHACKDCIGTWETPSGPPAHVPEGNYGKEFPEPEFEPRRGGGLGCSTDDGGEGNEPLEGRPQPVRNPGETAKGRTQGRRILPAKLARVNEAA